MYNFFFGITKIIAKTKKGKTRLKKILRPNFCRKKKMIIKIFRFYWIFSLHFKFGIGDEKRDRPTIRDFEKIDFHVIFFSFI